MVTMPKWVFTTVSKAIWNFLWGPETLQPNPTTTTTMKEPVNTKPSVNTTQEEKTSMASAVSSRGREIKKPACHTWSLNH
ncbi:unnamed protein product, partial [Pocillopora meandrina]